MKQKKQLTEAGLVLFVASMLPMNVLALSVTTADGNGADTYIQSTLSGNNAANQNFGTLVSVAIKHDIAIPGNNRKGYLRFDLNPVTNSISDASLQLTYIGTNSDAAANPSTYSVYGLIDGHSGENWDESTITWNNAPGNATGSAGGFLPGETTLLGSFNLSVPSTSIGDNVAFSSPDFVSFLQADTNDLVTILLTRQQQNFSIEYFSSKENTVWAAPTLNLTAVPIPAAAWLFTSGLLGLIALARRKAA